MWTTILVFIILQFTCVQNVMNDDLARAGRNDVIKFNDVVEEGRQSNYNNNNKYYRDYYKAQNYPQYYYPPQSVYPSQNPYKAYRPQYPYPTQQQYPYPQQQKPYPAQQYPYPYPQQPPQQYPYPYPQQLPTNQQYPYPYPPQQPTNIRDRYSLMQVLYSVAQYDDLQCVPRLICEMIADANIGIKPTLPFNFDMTSLIGLLSVVNGLNTSPIIYFSKAALLGISAKNNKYSTCYKAYPHCPTDPDKLVQYLNNHNGGFFRFFNGLPQQSFYKQAKAESRIQTKPVRYIPLSNDISNDNFIKFGDDDYYTNYNQIENSGDFQFPGVKRGRELNDFFYRPTTMNIKFPKTTDYQGHQESKLLFPLDNPSDCNFNCRNYQDFPSNFRKVKFLPYSDRTGTGDLKLDNDELY